MAAMVLQFYTCVYTCVQLAASALASCEAERGMTVPLGCRDHG